MKSTVKCNSCNRVLNEDQTIVAFRRNRCPKCGMKDSIEVSEYTLDDACREAGEDDPTCKKTIVHCLNILIALALGIACGLLLYDI